MSINFELVAEARHDLGKGASRRLRHDNKVPAVLYGVGKNATYINLNHNEVLKSLAHEAFYSHVLTINIDGQTERAVLKDVQRHPSKPRVMHMDFLRINENEKIRMHVPLHFINADIAPGVKQSGGIVSHLMIDVEITCLPKDLPEFIEVDLKNLHVNEAVHLSDLKLSTGVEVVALTHGAEHDLPVASIHVPRGSVEEAAAAAAAKPAAG